MADGGITSPGDLCKAFGAGADFVMIGGMFAGHTQSAGDMVEKDGQKFKRFYGMSSGMAMEKYNGGIAYYRSSEGKDVLVPYRGDVEGTIRDMMGGVRSACTYVGARNIEEMEGLVNFVRVA